MATLVIPVPDDVLRRLQQAAKERSTTPEAVAQDLVEHYVHEARTRSQAFKEAERVVDQKLKGGQ